MAINLVAAAAIAVLCLSLYLYKLNKAMSSVPVEARVWRPRPWTDEEIRETYERVCKEPIDFKKHLPPKLERRYIIVGGSGLVGGDIVLQLLARGQPPSSIRIVDFSPPSRPDLLKNSAAKVDHVKADITEPSSVEAAFAKPWPRDAAGLPLTVFHTAAVIRPGERSLLFWERSRRVNVGGTENVIAAAKRAGADVLVATSSASVSLRPVHFLIPPWRAHPVRWLQVCDEGDFDAPVRAHGDFFANYALSKALAERAVCAANSPALRTGCVRPGNGIYGSPADVLLGPALREGRAVSFSAHAVQSFVGGRNVALAHLQFEAALAGATPASTTMPKCAGRPLVVTDPGAPTQWADMYRAARALSTTPLEVVLAPPLALFAVAHAIEAWAVLLARVPVLARLGLSEPKGPSRDLQPAIWTPAAFVMVADGAARRSVAEGGIGYRGGCTTLEGLCEQLRDWNRSQGSGAAAGGGDEAAGTVLGGDLVEKHLVA